MSPRKKTISIIIAIGIFILIGCSSGTTPTPTPTGLLGIRRETEDPDVGWATIVYKWEDNQPPGWNVSVDVEIKVIIERDKNNPERYLVHGSRGTTYYIQVYGGGGGDCEINCNYPSQFFVEGELIRMDDAGIGYCQIPIKIYGDYDTENVERSGTCIQEAVENYGCAEAFLMFSKNESYWTFDKNNQIIEEDVPQGQVHRAEIKDIEWPKDLVKVCKWD